MGFKVGDRVRRRGILAELFGDDPGNVVTVRDDGAGEYRIEVEFGRHRALFFQRQLTLALDEIASPVCRPRHCGGVRWRTAACAR